MQPCEDARVTAVYVLVGGDGEGAIPARIGSVAFG